MNPNELKIRRLKFQVMQLHTNVEKFELQKIDMLLAMDNIDKDIVGAKAQIETLEKEITLTEGK